MGEESFDYYQKQSRNWRPRTNSARIVGKQEKMDSPFIHYAFLTDLSYISEPWDKSSKKQMKISSCLEFCL